MNNSDMPAMPQDADWKDDMERHSNSPERSGPPSFEGIGLTKREHFAAMAMQGFCANPDIGVQSGKCLAEYAIDTADALLTALEG